jgi:hypothetical protein
MSEITKEKALFVPEPYAVYMVKGLKTMVVSSHDYEEYIGKEILLAGRKIYGTIILKNKRLITKEQFDETRDVHKISETEYYDRGWGEPDVVLYAYDFEFTPFPDGPREINGMRKSFGEIWEIYTEIMPDITAEEYTTTSFTLTIPDIEEMENRAEILLDLNKELIFKPKGPWGEGFKACEKYVRDKHPNVKDPAGYCAAIYHNQKKKEVDEGIIETPSGYIIKLNKLPEDTELSIEDIDDVKAIVAINKTEYRGYTVESRYIVSIKIDKSRCPCEDYSHYREYEEINIVGDAIEDNESDN